MNDWVHYQLIDRFGLHVNERNDHSRGNRSREGRHLQSVYFES